MKMRIYIPAFFAALVSTGTIGCSNDDKSLDFGLDETTIEIGATGGTRQINIASSDGWTATASEPWITITPANGTGSVQCKIVIDSTLVDTPRQGIVTIQNQKSWENREVTVQQEGFEYGITLEEQEVSIENYAAYGKRFFDVKIRTNVDFDIQIPVSASSWLNYERFTVSDKLDRGIRPREVTVRFNWGINSRPEDRIAEVKFIPKRDVQLARQDGLKVTQGAAEAIPENTRKGDSIALLALARSLNTRAGWETSGPMNEWEGVQLWEEGMPGYDPKNEGRVRYAKFYIVQTKEGIPFEVQYLTAAEGLEFFSNINHFRYSLNEGEYLSKLTQLKRLSIEAYGLTSLTDGFKNLQSLESLNLGGNCFEEIPSILTKENFPKLRAIYLGANQRNLIYDLSNTVYTNFGGLYNETRDGRAFPRRMLEWDLDTLRLSVNYLQGELPTMEDYDRYTEADIAAYPDSLPPALIGTPKVMPHAKFFCINLNRLTGKIPFWLKYHPALIYWYPEILVFNQEGKDTNGKLAGFSDTPVNMDYYYDFYEGYKKRPEFDDFEE